MIMNNRKAACKPDSQGLQAAFKPCLTKHARTTHMKSHPQQSQPHANNIV